MRMTRLVSLWPECLVPGMSGAESVVKNVATMRCEMTDQYRAFILTGGAVISGRHHSLCSLVPYVLSDVPPLRVGLPSAARWRRTSFGSAIKGR